MKRSRKSNSVSWATGVGLCQMMLFSPGDAPNVCVQDYIHANPSSALPRSSRRQESDLPPGFEHRILKKPKMERSNLPMIQWRTPPLFSVNSEWRVAAGEESLEKFAQLRRESATAQAIPECAPISLGLCNDSRTPVIPVTPCEDDQSTDFPTQKPAADPHTVLSSAIAALVKSREQAHLIDTDLLVKILSDPEMIKRLLNGGTNSPGSEPRGGPLPATIPGTTSFRDCAYASPPPLPSSKDAEYIKNLIREHGGEKQELQNDIRNHRFDKMKSVLKIRQPESKPRFKKPCAYFMTKTGCRNGTQCPFQHFLSYPLPATSQTIKFGRSERL